MTRLCRTCKHWVNPCRFDAGTLRAVATCEALGGESLSTAFCPGWQQRTGEPLGTGVSRFWWHPTLFLEASIIHDLQYDLLKPGDNTAKIDKEWHDNALLLADSWAMRRVADIGYLVIRAFGVIKQSKSYD